MNVDNDEVEGAENRITVFVNCKIHDESGEVIGVVGVGMRITSLQAVLQGYEDKFGVGAFLVDGNGTIEISPQYTGYETVNLFDVTHYSDRVRREILTWKEEGMARSFWITGRLGVPEDRLRGRALPARTGVAPGGEPGHRRAGGVPQPPARFDHAGDLRDHRRDPLGHHPRDPRLQPRSSS